MTVAVGLSPRLPEARIRVAERRLSGRICQPFKRRSATPTRWVLHRGLKPTATLGRRSATKPNQLSTIRVRSSLGGGISYARREDLPCWSNALEIRSERN